MLSSFQCSHCVIFYFFGYLAEMSKSLCNHELSVVCQCCRHHQHWRCHVRTTLLSTHLITEIIYFTHKCTYAPSIGYPKLGHSVFYFSNVNHFGCFLYVPLLPTWLSLELSYLTELCIYTGAIHKEGIMPLWPHILKLMISFFFFFFF